MANPLRALSGHKGAACYPSYVGDPCSYYHLATKGGTKYTPDRLIGHAVITGDVAERFPLFDTLEHGCPC